MFEKKQAQKGSRKAIPTTQKGAVPVKWHEGRKRWEVSIYLSGQKKSRRYFRDEADALRHWRQHCQTVAEHGKHAATYDAARHREYEEAKRLAGDRDLRDVVREWQLSNVCTASMKVSDGITEYITANADRGLCNAHIRTVTGHLGRFAKKFGGRLMSGISSNEVLHFLLALDAHPRTLANYRVSLSSFFNWGERRGYGRSPLATITHSDLPIIPPPPREVLTVEQCEVLMRTVEQECPQFAVWHAIQIFAGIRNAEAGRFDFSWCNFERRILTMPGWSNGQRIVKTGDSWALHGLPANLWQWLERYREKFAIPPFKEISEFRKGLAAKLGIEEWPHNALRHTFCTMLCSLHGDAGRVATWSRHRSATMLFQNYLASLVSREEAERFCRILPS